MGNADSKNARKVRRAIRMNDAATLQKLVKQKVDLDLAINHYSRNTPLILASCYASVDVIPTLLKVCKDKDAYNAEGHTALDKAIMFYSLANEYHPNKTKELLRRRRVVQLLVDGGVSRVRSAELELWIRVNRNDPVFIHTLTHLFCRSGSTTLKSIGFAVMLRINADLTCAACFLEAGANYRNYKLMYLSDLPSIDYKMPVNLAVLILQSTCDHLVLQHIENIFLSAYPATRMKDEAREEILMLLLHNDHDIRYSHQKQYPEYEAYIENHRRSLKSLKWLCRKELRRRAYPNVFFAVHRLNLPKNLENYLLLNEDSHGEDPTLNASRNLNMGSNPPSAQIVRRRTVLSTPEKPHLRARPPSHYHPADEIEKKRHRYSHSSVPSSPCFPTASLAATSNFSPVKRRLRNQNTPYRQRPRSEAVAKRDMPIIQLSPITPRKPTVSCKKPDSQDQPDSMVTKTQIMNRDNVENDEKENASKQLASDGSNAPKPVVKNTSAPNGTKRAAAIQAVNVTPKQSPRILATVAKSGNTHQNIKKPVSKDGVPSLVQPSIREESVATASITIVTTTTKVGQKQSKPHHAQAKDQGFQNIAVPRPVAPTKTVTVNKQPVLSTFAPQGAPSLSPRRSPRDGKRARPHSHFTPASEVRNIFPPPLPSLQNKPMSRSFTEDGSGSNRKADQLMSRSYTSPGKVKGCIEYDKEFASHLEALMKRRSDVPSQPDKDKDTEFASHLQEALMKRRSQPPGQFLPTKEVLIDFGTPTDSPLATRSAGSTLNRQEVLLRPGSASLPRTDSSKRKSRASPPSSPFNLKVNPRFIVAGSSSAGREIAKPSPPRVEVPKTTETSSDSDYDEINESSNSSDDNNEANENEGYTRF